DDWRHILKTDNRPLAARRGDTDNIVINTFGGHSIHAVDSGAGTLNFMFWGAVQTGRWGLQKQRAGAVDAEAGFQPKILPQVKPWTFGYTGRSASGRRSLGNLYDTSLEYRVNPKLTMTGYFGYTQGLAVMKQIYPLGKDAKFGYVEGLYRF